jgi:hypothetical protein
MTRLVRNLGRARVVAWVVFLLACRRDDASVRAPARQDGAFPPTSLPREAITREEVELQNGSLRERWRLAWTDPPLPHCRDTEGIPSCPCQGFEDGEIGHLVLERRRPHARAELLDLGGLFADEPRESLTGFAALPGRAGAPRILDLADYDRDGRALEFPLRIGSEGCGHGRHVLVGVLAGHAELSVATTEEHPDRPLMLDSDTDFRALAKTGRLSRVYWNCMDHSSDVERAYEGTVERGVFHVRVVVRECQTRNIVETEAL